MSDNVPISAGSGVIASTDDVGTAVTVTISQASPGVVTDTGHGLKDGTPVVFTTSGSLPTGLTAGTTYYVLAGSTNSYNVAATPGGTAINTSSAGSGTHTRTSSIQVQRVKAQFGADGTATDVSTANPLPVTSQAYSATGVWAGPTNARKADTTAYAAGDVVGPNSGTSALTFSNMGPSGGRIMLTKSEFEIDDNGVISGETSYRIHLYNVTPPSAALDNAAWDLPSGDRSAYLGYIELGAPIDLGSTLYTKSNLFNEQITLSGTSLFGYLVTNSGYTPSSARVYKTTLHSMGL